MLLLERQAVIVITPQKISSWLKNLDMKINSILIDCVQLLYYIAQKIKSITQQLFWGSVVSFLPKEILVDVDMEVWVGNSRIFCFVEPQVNLRVQVVSPPKLPANTQILLGSADRWTRSPAGLCQTVSLRNRSRDLSDSTSPVGCGGTLRKTTIPGTGHHRFAFGVAR
jgi:hypothetical protein